jgi:hypothetical protein
MRFKSTITIFLTLLMASSIFLINTVPTTDNYAPQSVERSQNTYTTSADFSLPAPSILVYTEFVDDRTGQEYENTMTAINNTYGTNYLQTNLTDYNNLDSLLPGKDILLIPEQELANIATMKGVGTLWASTLTTFVNDGGVVVLLDFGNTSAPGLGLHIYNESSLMQFGPVLGQYPSAALTEMHRHTFGDALCRRIEYRWTPQNHTFAVTNTDGNNAIDDYSTDNRVVIHKMMGRGHIVFMGFDLQYTGPNYEQIVGNAIRLPHRVVFDNAQDTEYTWEFPPPHVDGFAGGKFVEDLLDAGFAVSRMDTFDSGFFNASDVVICTLPYATTDDYDAAEVTALDAYVADGGSIFIQSDWSTYGDEIAALANNFGYYFARDCIWDTDDLMRYWKEAQIYFTGDNLLSHPITTNVDRVEFYASDGFSALPTNAEKIIVADWDGTTCWGEGGWYDNWLGADGFTTMAVSKYGSGRVCVVLDGNFMDGINDEDADGLEDYLDSDNDVLLMNTIHWLAGIEASNDAPQLTGLTHLPASPIHGDPVSVNVSAVDADGLENITCYFRDNLGTWQSVPMTPLSGDLYTAAIGNFNSSEEKDYYVRAFDSSTDKMESVSSVVYLNGINYFPETPMLYDPGTSDDDGVFLLNWTASIDADGFIDHYEIQVSNDSQFATTLDMISADTDDYMMTVFENDTYYFRVRAVDDDGTMGFWSFQQWINVVITTEVTNTPPTISSLNHSPIVPMNGIIVTISANINDADGIDNATCYYRVNSGSWTPVAMVPGVGDDYSANIGSFEEKDFVEYYVRAFDNSNVSLETVSSVGSFEVYNHLPDIPVLTDPGTFDDDGVFLLNWTESHDEDGYVDHYEVQMDDTGTFSVLLDSWTVTTNETWVNIINNGTYYFRVKALDDHGEYAGFSNVVSIEVGISIDIHPPVIADLYTHPAIPIHGDSVIIKAEVLDFTGIENVTCHYRVNGGSWITLTMLHVSGGDRYEIDIGSFLVDDLIEYYVQAFDNSTQYNEGTSSTQSFYIENQVPLAPEMLDPGTSISVSHFIANWTAGSDHEGALDHYQFQVSISSEFATIFGEWNTTELSFNVTGLSNGVYYLRVRAIDDHDAASPWSDVESIEIQLGTTSPTVPPQPTTSPTTGSPFDPDILNLVFLITTAGSLVIIIIVVLAIVRQRSRARRQYHI